MSRRRKATKRALLPDPLCIQQDLLQHVFLTVFFYQLQEQEADERIQALDSLKHFEYVFVLAYYLYGLRL